MTAHSSKLQQLRLKLERLRPIAIWGIGLEGKSSVKLFECWDWEEGRDFHIFDNQPNLVFNRPAVHDKSLLDNMDRYRLILRSPGIPILRHPEAMAHSDRITTQTALFFEFFHDLCIGVSGTKGKSTCVHLLQDIFHRSHVPVRTIGNIGIPPFDALLQSLDVRYYLAECSSYQLQELRHSPRHALFLNFHPEHLDFHGSVEAYAQSKANLFAHPQNNRHEAFFCASAKKQLLPYVCFQQDSSVTEVPVAEISFRPSPALVHPHLQEMLSLVLSFSDRLQLPEEAVHSAIQQYEALPYRLEQKQLKNGITVINDSISTIPQSCLAAMKAYPQASHLILGGKSRGIDQSILLPALQGFNGRICCLHETGKEIFNLLHSNSSNVFYYSGLEEALSDCFKNSHRGDTFLFSPGAASYDCYRDYKERGNAFFELCSRFAG